MSLFSWLGTATTPPSTPNPLDVTPGWIGFLAIFFIAVATVLLILDMTRRIRRVRYREEVREKLAAEEQVAQPPVR